jgi:hypothetical protein
MVKSEESMVTLAKPVPGDALTGTSAAPLSGAV